MKESIHMGHQKTNRDEVVKQLNPPYNKEGLKICRDEEVKTLNKERYRVILAWLNPIRILLLLKGWL